MATTRRSFLTALAAVPAALAGVFALKETKAANTFRIDGLGTVSIDPEDSGFRAAEVRPTYYQFGPRGMHEPPTEIYLKAIGTSFKVSHEMLEDMPPGHVEIVQAQMTKALSDHVDKVIRATSSRLIG